MAAERGKNTAAKRSLILQKMAPYPPHSGSTERIHWIYKKKKKKKRKKDKKPKQEEMT
jgi:hypothetical protein